MPDSMTYRSPIHAWLEQRNPHWAVLQHMAVAMHFGAPEQEQQFLQTLALCDHSFTPQFSFKGPAAADWLAQQGLTVPSTIFAAQRLEHDDLLFRVGADEFLLQCGLHDELAERLRGPLDSELPGCHRLVRQDATFLVSGSQAVQVLAQTCGVDFQQSPQQKLVFTRVAGVSCSVLPDTHKDCPTFQITVDPSWSLALWESLVTIVEDLGGTVVGLGSLYPTL